jgi:predicted cobalt transporter CbtA
MANPIFAVTLLVGLLLPLFPWKDEGRQRQLYWIGTVIASVSGLLALYPPDLDGGLILAAGVATVLVFRAYMGTSHIRIGGRIYAFNLSDSHADDAGRGDPDYDPAPNSYAGLATATKMWWLFAVIMLACAFMVGIYVMEGEGPWYALGGAVVVVLTAVLAGHQDASWEYGVARGQWVQFVIAGIGTLAIFTALYLLAYTIGRKKPLRPKRSMEYRAHPHLREKFP